MQRAQTRTRSTVTVDQRLDGAQVRLPGAVRDVMCVADLAAVEPFLCRRSRIVWPSDLLVLLGNGSSERIILGEDGAGSARRRQGGRPLRRGAVRAPAGCEVLHMLLCSPVANPLTALEVTVTLPSSFRSQRGCCASWQGGRRRRAVLTLEGTRRARHRQLGDEARRAQGAQRGVLPAAARHRAPFARSNRRRLDHGLVPGRGRHPQAERRHRRHAPELRHLALGSLGHHQEDPDAGHAGRGSRRVDPVGSRAVHPVRHQRRPPRLRRAVRGRAGPREHGRPPRGRQARQGQRLRLGHQPGRQDAGPGRRRRLRAPERLRGELRPRPAQGGGARQHGRERHQHQHPGARPDRCSGATSRSAATSSPRRCSASSTSPSSRPSA